jgi:hypothetical protein
LPDLDHDAVLRIAQVIVRLIDRFLFFCQLMFFLPQSNTSQLIDTPAAAKFLE